MLKNKIVLNEKDFGKQQDAMFHLGESYVLAEGEGWQCRLENCGIQRIMTKDGLYRDEDVLEIYNTDKKLNKAINKGDIVIFNNSWWEVNFFKEVENELKFLDLYFFLDTVVFTVGEGIKLYKDLIKSEQFWKDLEEEMNRV